MSHSSCIRPGSTFLVIRWPSDSTAFIISFDIALVFFSSDISRPIWCAAYLMSLAAVSLFRWFENNFLKKMSFLVNTSQEVSLNVNIFKIKNSNWEKLCQTWFYLDLIIILHIRVEELAGRYTHQLQPKWMLQGEWGNWRHFWGNSKTF